MTGSNDQSKSKRRRSAPLLWGSGAVAAAILILGINGTLSSWTTAVMSNGQNHAGTSAAVALDETGPDSTGTSVSCTTTTTLTNHATCDQINKYGDNGVENTTMLPGSSVTTTVTLTNSGTGDGSTFTMGAGACSSVYNTGSDVGNAPLSAADVCGELQVAVSCTGDATLTVPATSLADFAAQGDYTLATGLASGDSSTCVFTVSLPSTATSSFSGQTATQAITWTLAV